MYMITYSLENEKVLMAEKAADISKSMSPRYVKKAPPQPFLIIKKPPWWEIVVARDGVPRRYILIRNNFESKV